MPQSADIEQRVRRLEDLEQIRQLVQDYRRHLDTRDLDAYSRLFADDGEWLGGTGYGKGPAGIAAMLKARLEGNPPPPGPTSWHVVTDPRIELDGDSASGQVTWALLQRGDGDVPVMRLLGHYDDTYVKTGGGWRFQRRIARTDIPHRDLQFPDDWQESAPAREAAGTDAAAGDGVPASLRRLEDAEQIRRLLADYKIALDSQDFKSYAALFAADGEFAAGAGSAHGHEAIQAMVEAMPGSGLLGAEPGSDFHVMVNPRIELDAENPDRARASSAWIYVVRGDGDVPVLAKLGHYDDELVREDGRWRFRRRSAPSDIPMPDVSA